MKKWIIFSILISLSSLISAQYCTPQGMCVFNDVINNFEVNGLSNLNSGGSNCGNNQNPGPAYIHDTTRTTSLTQGSKYPFYLQGITGRGSRAQGFGIWIDYNQDGIFQDPEEVAFHGITIGARGMIELTNQIELSARLEIIPVPSISIDPDAFGDPDYKYVYQAEANMRFKINRAWSFKGSFQYTANILKYSEPVVRRFKYNESLFKLGPVWAF